MTIKDRVYRHVHGYVDVRGKPRHYFRRPGFKGIELPGRKGSPEFLAALDAAWKATTAESPVKDIGADSVTPRSLRALASSYYESAAFKALKSSTQGVYRNIADRLCNEVDRDGKPYADKIAAHIRRDHIEKLMDMRKEKPDSANGLRKVLREMMKVAVLLKWRTDDPTQGIKKIKPKNKPGGEKGFHRWTDAEVAQFEARHPIGSKARLAMTLGLYSGQARQDVIAMGEQHISLEWDTELEGEIEILNWVRLKTETSTGLELAIPVHPTLREVINATPSGHALFVVTEFGKPFTAAGFGNWFRDRCNEAGLPHCSFHGLRKAAATRLIDMGCDVVEVAAITGHASLKELQRYIETRDRKKAARRAMRKLISGTELANKQIRLAYSGKKS